ncbi:MAG: winged helix-turn-helix transcriptional regulator [Lentisphaerales bacterium]|nr:winged helix-turn-helix transcriptional regulator [Lentisphaerales bacterium]
METKDNNKNFDQSQYHELEILKTVDEDSLLNNRKAASKLGVSVKLAHTTLSRMVEKGLLNIKKENSRKWHYFLTPQGILEKARLTVSFFEFSIQFYKEARKLSAQLCRNLSECERKRVILLGNGELAEITYLGIQEWGLELIDVISTEGQTAKFMDMTTISINENFKKHDAMIVCLYDPSLPMGSLYLPEGVEKSDKMEWIFK